jgi:hypothetical protein
MLHIYDPLEYEFSKEIFFPSISPESNEGKRNSGFINPGELGSLDEMTNYLKNASVKYRITVKSLSVKEEVGKSLKDFFHLKKRVIV